MWADAGSGWGAWLRCWSVCWACGPSQRMRRPGRPPTSPTKATIRSRRSDLATNNARPRDPGRRLPVRGGDHPRRPHRLRHQQAGDGHADRRGDQHARPRDHRRQQPVAVAITPDGHTAYVTNADGMGRSRRSTWRPTRPAPRSPSATTRTGWRSPRTAHRLRHQSGAGTVTPIDVATNTPGPAITVGNSPYGVAVTPDGQTAYVVNDGDDTVTPIDVATNTPGPAITVGGARTGWRSPPTARPPTSSTTAMGRSHRSTWRPTRPAPRSPSATTRRGVAITPDGRTAYVINSDGGGTVTPIDVATNTPGTAITVGVHRPGWRSAPIRRRRWRSRRSPSPLVSRRSLDAWASTSPVGSIAHYTWNFGDGQIGFSTTPVTQHVYAAGGSYTVRLTLTNTAGTSVRQVFTGQTM